MTRCLQIIRMTMIKTRFNRRYLIPVFTLIHVSNVPNTRVRSVMTSRKNTQNTIPIGRFLTIKTRSLRMCTRPSVINLTRDSSMHIGLFSDCATINEPERGACRVGSPC